MLRCKAMSVTCLNTNTFNQKHFSCQPKALKTTLGSWEELGESEEQGGKTQVLANKHHKDDKGYSNSWMLRSSHRLLSSIAALTQAAVLSRKRPQGNSRRHKSRVSMFSSPTSFYQWCSWAEGGRSHHFIPECWTISSCLGCKQSPSYTTRKTWCK